LPIKFAETIEEAIGRAPDRPASFVGIEDKPQHVTVMPADVNQVKVFLAKHTGL
jgi:threonine synthase